MLLLLVMVINVIAIININDKCNLYVYTQIYTILGLHCGLYGAD